MYCLIPSFIISSNLVLTFLPGDIFADPANPYKSMSEAAKMYKQVIEIDEKDIDCFCNYGILLSSPLNPYKSYKKAHDMYSRALEVNDKSVEILYNFGNLLCEKDNPNKVRILTPCLYCMCSHLYLIHLNESVMKRRN